MSETVKISKSELINMRVNSYNDGYEQAYNRIMRKIYKIHDKEFDELVRLLDTGATGQVVAFKTNTVATLEKLINALEAM